MAFAEATQVERTDREAEVGEMRSQVAGPVGLTWMLEHEEEHAEFPPFSVTDRAAALRDLRVGPKKADRFVVVPQQAAVACTGVYEISVEDISGRYVSSTSKAFRMNDSGFSVHDPADLLLPD